MILIELFLIKFLINGEKIMPNIPGNELRTRPLHFFWVVDVSGSMAGEKIQQLNTAIHEAIPAMKKVADENPNAQLYIRTLAFSSGARWLTPSPIKIEDFHWQDLQTESVTDMGKAFSLLADQLSEKNMPQRGLPPVIVLLSDGQPTDDYLPPLQRLLSLPWGAKAIRIAIAIGKDADIEVLEKFISHKEVGVLRANNADTLAKYIRWSSTVPVRSASAPAVPNQAGAYQVPVPAPNDPSNQGPAVW